MLKLRIYPRFKVLHHPLDLPLPWPRFSFLSLPNSTSFRPAASGPIGALNGSCEAKLSVIPKVSGLERSQERNYEADRDPLLVPFLPKEPPSQAAMAPIPAQALPPSPPNPPPTRTRAQTPTAVRGTPQPKGQPPPTPQGGAGPHNFTQGQHMKVPPFTSQAQAPYAVGLDLSTGGWVPVLSIPRAYCSISPSICLPSFCPYQVCLFFLLLLHLSGLCCLLLIALCVCVCVFFSFPSFFLLKVMSSSEQFPFHPLSLR